MGGKANATEASSSAQKCKQKPHTVQMLPPAEMVAAELELVGVLSPKEQLAAFMHHFPNPKFGRKAGLVFSS